MKNITQAIIAEILQFKSKGTWQLDLFLVHLWQKSFVFKKNPSKVRQNPFVPKESWTCYKSIFFGERLFCSKSKRIRTLSRMSGKWNDPLVGQIFVIAAQFHWKTAVKRKRNLQKLHSFLKVCKRNSALISPKN